MSNKDSRKSAEVLLYLSRCADAVKKVPIPEGFKLEFKLASLTKAAGTRLGKVKGIIDVYTDGFIEGARESLKDLDSALERASRKKKGKK